MINGQQCGQASESFPKYGEIVTQAIELRLVAPREIRSDILRMIHEDRTG